MIRSDLFASMINKGIKNIHISGWFPTNECYCWSTAVSNKCWLKTRRSTSAADDSWIHPSWAPPLIAAPGWAGSTRVKLPAMGRVDGWMLLGPLIRGVGPWPHQSGQTRQGPDSVTRAGWLVRWGAPVGIYGPAVFNTPASGRRIIRAKEHSTLKYLSIFLLCHREQQPPGHMTQWLRNGYWAVCRWGTDTKLLISLKHRRQTWHLRHWPFFQGVVGLLLNTVTHSFAEMRGLIRLSYLSIEYEAAS